MGNNVLVSDTAQAFESYPAGGDYVVVFTDYPQKLTLGAKYVLTVEVQRSKTTGYEINDLKLKGAVEQKD
jgi:hypothetical protein